MYQGEVMSQPFFCSLPEARETKGRVPSLRDRGPFLRNITLTAAAALKLSKRKIWKRDPSLESVSDFQLQRLALNPERFKEGIERVTGGGRLREETRKARPLQMPGWLGTPQIHPNEREKGQLTKWRKSLNFREILKT